MNNMKQNGKRFTALLLCLAMCFALCLPVRAANDKGIVFTASLSQTTLDKSDSEQTVVLNVVPSAPIKLDSIDYVVSYDSALTLKSFESGDSTLTYTASDLNTDYGEGQVKLTWVSSDAEDVVGVTSIGKITFTVPAGTDAGDYEFAVTELNITEEYGTPWEDAGSASATLSIVDGAGEEEPVTFSASVTPAQLDESSEEQTVVLNVVPSAAFDMDSIDYVVSYDPALVLKSFESGDSTLAYTTSDLNTAYGQGKVKLTWVSSDAEDVVGVTSIGKITFTVPAGTEAGTYGFDVTEINITKEYGTPYVDGASASASFEIAEVIEPESYTVSLADPAAVSVDDTVYVNITLLGCEEFSASEITVTYDNSKLTFDKASSTLNGAEVMVGSGSIDLADYGANQTAGIAYTLAFTAISDGNAQVKIASAAFSQQENAATEDLVSAVISKDTATVKISKKEFSVTLPAIFTGNSVVANGGDYTFAAADAKNYTYSNITATVEGLSVPVTANGDGTWTVKNVAGELVISGNRAAKRYSVVFLTGSDVAVPGNGVAVYNEDYMFMLPVEEHYSISVTSIRIGTKDVPYSVKDGFVTIAGGNITGDITVVLDKVRTDAAVSVEGTGASDAAGYVPYAIPGEAYTLTVNQDTKYDYAVSAKVNDVEVTVSASGNQYTVVAEDVVAGSIVFTVNRALKTSGVSVSKYLTLNGTSMWLVQNSVSKLSSSIYTYKGSEMFWSDQYDAYVYLVIAVDAPVVSAADLGLISGAAVNVDYGMDVKKTGRVDANDAQLVYNFYNAHYGSFTSNVTVEKFLSADVNGDAAVNVEDAAMIINEILK